MKGFLKCYYGYQNFGDELLFFGIADYIFTHFDITRLVVEVGDKDQFAHWLAHNRSLCGQRYDKISLVQNSSISTSKIRGSLKFFGGGEVFTDARPFPYDGRNYFLKYFRDIVMGKFVVMGGIGTPTRWTTYCLYLLMLPRARQIIVREKTSYELCKRYNSHTILYEDFSFKVIQKLLPQLHLEDSQTILINIHTHIRNSSTKKKILNYCKQYPDHRLVYVPFDISPSSKLNDMMFYEKLLPELPQLELRDRSHHSLLQTLQLFASCTAGIGARLHFLYLLKVLKKPFDPIVYQEKIKKLILDDS